MTEKDILGYENDSDTDKGNDPTEWTDWGKDNSPKLKFTLPVNANDRSLPSINIFFMDPVNGVTSTMDSVWNTWGLRMSEEEKVGNTNGGAASYFNSPSNGTVSIFAGPNSNVTRGWHYVFAYKARLTFRNNSNYIFPNMWMNHPCSHRRLLRTIPHSAKYFSVRREFHRQQMDFLISEQMAITGS